MVPTGDVDVDERRTVSGLRGVDPVDTDGGGATRSARPGRDVAFRELSGRSAVPATGRREAPDRTVPVIVIVAPERFGLPAVPSVRVLCDRCGASCWLSKRAELGAAGDGTGGRAIDGFLCVVCAMAVVKPGDTIEPGPWVVADLADQVER